MKSLKNLIALSQNVKIYVPSTMNVDTPIDNGEFVHETLSMLSSCFGGSTSFEALGAWHTKQGNLIKERVVICQSFCNEQALSENIEKVYEFCCHLKSVMGQEAIALEVNNVLHFV